MKGPHKIKQDESQSEHKQALDTRELDLKDRELSLRERELDIQLEHAKKVIWKNPIFVAIVGGFLALASNAIVAYINGRAERSLILYKAEADRILEALKTGDPDKAAENLEFLVEAGLISQGADSINRFIRSREAGEGPSLPASGLISKRRSRIGLQDWINKELVLDGIVRPADSGPKVKRIQEWLCLHGFHVVIDGTYGLSTAEANERFSSRKKLEKKNFVDQETFSVLVAPMQRALAPVEIADKSLNQLVVELAKNHLAQHPREIGGQNRGPWVRLYMQGNEGVAWAWTAGFTSFIIREAAGHLDIDPPVSSLSCDVLAAQAKSLGIFSKEGSGRQPIPGDIMLMRRTSTDWIHCGVIIEVENDTFITIEGNTNDEGTREGFEVARRIRPFSRKDFILLSALE